MLYKIISIIVVPVLLIVTAVIVIAYARGYRFDTTNPGLNSTGILVATSEPNGAQVFIDGEFSGATNSNINLDPGNYDVTITKEGYHTWNRTMRVQGEIVVTTGATLFLRNPGLAPLTATGVQDPIISSDMTKIAYIASPSATGIVGKNVYESTIEAPTLFVYDFAGKNLPFSKNPQPYSGTREQLIDEWELEATIARDRAIASLPPSFGTIATASMRLLSFSPDDTKVLYEATASAMLTRSINPPLLGSRTNNDVRVLEPGEFYVYDAKEDRNYHITEELGDLADKLREKVDVQNTLDELDARNRIPANRTDSTASHFEPLPVFWFGTSQHLVLVGNNTISLMEFDGGNKTLVYSGPFENGYVFSHLSGHQLIIMTTFNPEASMAPSLYTLNLR